jgi:enterobactin synthetase component D
MSTIKNYPNVTCAAVNKVVTHKIRAARLSTRVFLIDFDASRFTLDAFSICEIRLPKNIAKSVPKRQAEYFFGRLAAKFSMSRLLVTPTEVKIGDLRQPVWPSGLIGSISHTNSIAASLVLRKEYYKFVGIDVEYIGALDESTALSARVINKREHAYLMTFNKLSMKSLLTIVFSAKESFFKGAFRSVGRYFDFSSVTVTNLCLDQGILTLSLTETLSGDFVKHQDFNVYIDFIHNDSVLTSFIK